MSVVLKAKLKAAKAAIGDKDYEYAYSLSHDVLEMDGSSYPAHIYLGVACQHLAKWDEGAAVYLRAQGLPKANALAWQGACALHEAAGDEEKHVAALERLRAWYVEAGELERAWETMYRVLKLAEASGDERRLVAELGRLTDAGDLAVLLSAGACAHEVPSTREVLERMLAVESAYDARTVERETEKRRTRLSAGGIDKVRSDVRREVWGASRVLQTLARLVQESMAVGDDAARFAWEERYLDELRARAPYVAGQEDELAAEALRVAEDLAQHGRSPQAFELLLDTWAAAQGHSADVRALAADYLRAFAEQAAQDGLALGSAARALALEDAEAALAAADEGRRRAPASAFAQTVWAAAAGAAGAYDALAEGAAAARAAAGTQKGAFLVEKHVAAACLRLGLAQRALAAYARCGEIKPDDAEARLGMGLAHLALGHTADARPLLQRALDEDSHSAPALAGLGAATLDDDAAQAAGLLRRALAVDDAVARVHCDLGRALWRMGGAWRRDKQHAFASFLQAARLDPMDAAAFAGLGAWYDEVAQDAARATRCLEKSAALDLAGAGGGVAERLARLYAQAGADDRLERLLLRATTADREGTAAADAWPWAWRMLGLLHVRRGGADEHGLAERALRRALALDRADHVAWLALGDAYLQGGRAGAAARVAQHVAALRPEDPAAHYLGARACLQAGDAERALAEATLAAKKALAGTAWSRVLPALRVRVLCACAARRHAAGLFGRAADACVDALAAVAEAELPPAALWNAVGVACMWLVRVRPAAAAYDAHVRVLADRAARERLAEPAYLRATRPPAAADAVFALAEDAAGLCVAAARTLEQAGAAWHALGCAYLARHAAGHARPLHASGRADGAVLRAAARCAQAAVRLQAPCAYLLQGAVAAWAGDAMLAQHAFILATRQASGPADAWAALAVLYADRGDRGLARKAAARAVLLDAEHPGARLAAALAAELAGDARTADLYEACVRLPDAARAIADYAFARHAWQLHRAAAKMDHGRLALAAYAAQRYAERAPGEPQAFLLRAQLLELSGPRHAEAAASAYARYADATGDADALASRARALCAAGLFADSVAAYADAEAAGWTPGALGHVAHGTALFFAGMLEPALRCFELALDSLPAEDAQQRAAVGLRLAQVLWALDTPEHRVLARDQLAHAADAQSVAALCALVAVAALLADAELLAAAYPMLMPLRSTHPVRVARVEALVECLLGNLAPAYRAVARAAVYVPQDAGLRLLGVRLATWAEDGKRALGYAREALCLLDALARSPDAMPSDALDIAVAACKVVALQAGCRRSARRAVVLCPWDAGVWDLLPGSAGVVADA
ncbi:Superkiller protein 3 [Coemansia interrupta]|uniref:Superkiller protein 3 n=1 Tax=Coemansia interrupta TaxID=1126814 RepID=A0A9W8HGU8_9FUNG|nr:Superkiller protein 3 [Coemansia interrupta]